MWATAQIQTPLSAPAHGAAREVSPSDQQCSLAAPLSWEKHPPAEEGLSVLSGAQDGGGVGAQGLASDL